MFVRLASENDFSEIKNCYEIARSYMRTHGNASQWINGFPQDEIIHADILRRELFVVSENNTNAICGVFAFIIGNDETYKKINGSWKNDFRYGTIHRLASNGKSHGIFESALAFCKTKIGKEIFSIRIDTHEENKTMQNAIEKFGFQKCGIIWQKDGSERIAYQL